METKSSIRKKMLSLRDGMSDKERIEHSNTITETILGLDMVSRARDILCFVGYKSEVITMELITELLHRGKNVYVPRVNGDEMDFYRIDRVNDLKEGYKGIPEPAETCKDIYTGEKPEDTVMFMPGAVFAKDGSRIGYGKGYYDRYLAKYDIMNRIALCFSVQLLDDIPSDAHDKKASVIVTEKGITECRKVLY